MFTDELRDELNSLAVRMEKIEQIEEMGGTLPTGLLFFGPAGTGKTLTACSLAKTAGWAFVNTSGNDLLRDQGNIDKLLREASELRPCIVFIDEADDVLALRTTSPYGATVTNKLLTAMDGAGGKIPDVLFIAATNHPENLDPATMRGGRFTEKVEFTLPDETTILAMVNKWRSTLKIEVRRDLKNEEIARQLVGLAPANINATLQAAVNRAATRGLGNRRAIIEIDDVLAGMESVMAAA